MSIKENSHQLTMPLIRRLNWLNYPNSVHMNRLIWYSYNMIKLDGDAADHSMILAWTN